MERATQREQRYRQALREIRETADVALDEHSRRDVLVMDAALTEIRRKALLGLDSR